MQHDHTLLKHNSLMSQKKVVTKAMIIKGVYFSAECSSFENCSKCTASTQFDHMEIDPKRSLISHNCFTGSHPIPLLSCD
jgi:hypothetical protein